MKKLAIALFALILFTQIGFAFDTSKFTIPLENKLSFFQDEHWWLRSQEDILRGSKYFYSPIEKDTMFNGVYYRFQKNELVMHNFIVKDTVSAKKILQFVRELGKTKKLKDFSYVSLKTSYTAKNKKGAQEKIQATVAVFPVSIKQVSQVLIVPATALEQKTFKGSLLEAYLKTAKPLK